MREYYLMSQIESLAVTSNLEGEPMFDVVLKADAVLHRQSAHGADWTPGVLVYSRVRGYLPDENKSRDHYHEYAEEFKKFKANLLPEGLDELRTRICSEFEKHWELNDRAHRIEHFDEVNRCATHINEKLGLECDPKLILLAAFFHDMFAWSRHNHERLSHEWVSTTDHSIFAELDKEDISFESRELVALACLEHRASYDGEFSNQFSELMSAADRGFPGDVMAMVNRATLYRVDRGADIQTAMHGVRIHVKEKYGTGGYARYPALYLQAFGEELDAQRKEIDAL